MGRVRWHPRLVLSDAERRDLLGQVVTDVVPRDVQIEWMDSEGWSAQVRLEGSTGLVGFLLTSAAWQEARFAEPRRTTFLLTDGSDSGDVREALARLARAVKAYVSGDSEVERKRGLFGPRTTLIVHSEDGPWRIGQRTTRPPRFAD